ncbi:ATP-binding protein [Ureibacillus sinduriensis]|uniref:ATPase n=1 Tax=Ureibacillus sinduriensis BLB-1 = JCM 15800 TaxID=1384057 RepID=A0A0A3IVS7_9BACL|nr:ATP-binding protein [Ureibacillus sinduriensis]KGR78927.1 ATPase [Ureibacillus sinduriensis BLB-1 = JCM 15800]
MKKSYEKKQLYILLNQILVIMFLCYQYTTDSFAGTETLIPLIIISLIIIDAAYISYKNIKGNITLSRFTNLLILVAWQFLFSLDVSSTFYTLSTLLSVVILYKSIQFLFIFFFQDTTYTYKQRIGWTLTIICLMTLISLFINERLFAILFLLQWVLSFGCITFLFLKHRKRIAFVLSSEKRHFLKTGLIIFISFVGYVMIFADKPEYLSNFGWYVMIIFPLFSVHSIAFKNTGRLGAYIPFKKTNVFGLCLLALISICLLGLLFGFNIINHFIIIHMIFLFVLLRFSLIYKELQCAIMEKDNYKVARDNFYAHNLMQVRKEEELKSDVSNYLHDEILQDILSIKNMINKSDKEEVRTIIFETLDDLNLSIRDKMQEFHPTLLKSLTLKENYGYLLKTLQQKNGKGEIVIVFNCKKDLFLVDPYHLVVYRILKELVTNAIKHSHCSKITVTLKQENEQVELIVSDDGTGLKEKVYGKVDSTNHKGLNSINEQLFLLNGKMTISENEPNGLYVCVQIFMKGEDSYQYFINR